MYFLYSLKNKCSLSGNFPKIGLFLIDELFIIFKHSKQEHLDILNSNERIYACIIKVIEDLKMEKLVNKAYELTQKDSIYHGVFFDDGIPIVKNINNYFSSEGMLPATLSEIFIKLTIKTTYDGKRPFVGFKGYELLGAIALFYIRNAFKLTNKENQKSKTGKSLNQLSKQIKKNEFSAIEFLLQASEAIILAKELKFEHRQKNIIETAKYLIERTRQNTENEITAKATLEAKEKAIRDNAKKAVEARHKKTNEIKNKVLEEYQQESIKYKEQGRTLSKNDFAQKMAVKYKLSYTTIRNNWLKGYNPKI